MYILIKYGSNIDENPVPNSIGEMTIPDGKIKHGTCGISPLLGIPSDMETPELAYSQGISSLLKKRGGKLYR